MDRRQFLQQVAALSVVYGVGHVFTFPRELLAMSQGKPEPVLGRATSSDYAKNVVDAIDQIGGIKKFVKTGETVVVKPNMAWDRPPEMAANTHPLVVRRLVELCLEAGAKQVKVLDRTCHDARRAYANSGIQAAVEGLKDSRAVVEFVDERRFVEMDIPGAKALKRWSFYKDILEADRFINVPIAKHHSESRLTLAMKNMMGAIGGWRGRCHVGLHQNIADMNLVLRADLTVLDATRLLTQGGPAGGKLEYVKVRNQVIAGTDPVAIDSYGATLFDLAPSDLGYIVKAHELGLGEMDLAKIKLLGS